MEHWLCARKKYKFHTFSGRAGEPTRPRPTALLSPSSNGKPKAATAVVVIPDDGHEDA